MNKINILIYNKGYRSEGRFIDCPGIFDAENEDKLIELFVTNLSKVLPEFDNSYESYKSNRIRRFDPQFIQSNQIQNDFYSSNKSKTITTFFGTIEFKIKEI